MQITQIHDNEILTLPLLRDDVLRDGEVHIYIWCHTFRREELEALATAMHWGDLVEAFAETHDKRFAEKVSVRLMLHRLLGGEAEIVYRDNGAPCLADGRAEISVSHTAGTYALSLSRRKHGTDIEAWGAKALKVCRMYLNEEERRWVDALPQNEAEREAVVLWSAKEAVYKLAGIEGLSFKEQIALTPRGDNALEATLKPSGERLTVECGRQAGFALTCCAENVSR